MKLWPLSLACLIPLLPAGAASVFELRLKSGECLIGEVLSADAEIVVFSSPQLGRLPVPQSQIASLQPHLDAPTPPAQLPAGEAADRSPHAPREVAPEPLPLSPIAEASADLSPAFGAKVAHVETPSPAPPPPAAADSHAPAEPPVVGQSLREEDIRQVFLRDSTIVLAPGRFEAETTLSYARQEVTSVDTLLGSDLRRFQRRLAQLQFSLRYSPVKRVEIFGTLPVAYGEQHLVRLDGEGSHRSVSGLGDFSLGLKWLAVRESAGTPDVVFAVTATAPTGRSPYRTNVADFGFGNGHWALGAGVQVVRTYDPVVVFGGLEYTHYFSTDALGGSIEPGGTLSYNLGFGFALNDQLSFSTQFAGSIQAEGRSSASGVKLPSRENLVLRMAMTARLSPESYLEPAIAWGLTDDSPDYQLSLSYAKRF